MFCVSFNLLMENCNSGFTSFLPWLRNGEMNHHQLNKHWYKILYFKLKKNIFIRHLNGSKMIISINWIQNESILKTNFNLFSYAFLLYHGEYYQRTEMEEVLTPFGSYPIATGSWTEAPYLCQIPIWQELCSWHPRFIHFLPFAVGWIVSPEKTHWSFNPSTC